MSLSDGQHWKVKMKDHRQRLSEYTGAFDQAQRLAANKVALQLALKKEHLQVQLADGKGNNCFYNCIIDHFRQHIDLAWPLPNQLRTPQNIRSVCFPLSPLPPSLWDFVLYYVL